MGREHNQVCKEGARTRCRKCYRVLRLERDEALSARYGINILSWQAADQACRRGGWHEPRPDRAAP